MWVDLGLPSGLKWAKYNLGANIPESYGIYFSWGNLDGHPAGSAYNFSQGTYNQTPAASISSDLSLSQDAARAILGAPWRMPTSAEFQELIDNCSSEWTTLKGINGRLFTSNVNGKTLFLPAAGLYIGASVNNRGSGGDYWASTLNSETTARRLGFTSTGVTNQGGNDRYFGFSIRAVQDGTPNRSVDPPTPET